MIEYLCLLNFVMVARETALPPPTVPLTEMELHPAARLQPTLTVSLKAPCTREEHIT